MVFKTWVLEEGGWTRAGLRQTEPLVRDRGPCSLGGSLLELALLRGMDKSSSAELSRAISGAGRA